MISLEGATDGKDGKYFNDTKVTGSKIRHCKPVIRGTGAPIEVMFGSSAGEMKEGLVDRKNSDLNEFGKDEGKKKLECWLRNSTMTVVDDNVLSALAKVGRLILLTSFFEKVLTTPEVMHELKTEEFDSSF